MKNSKQFERWSPFILLVLLVALWQGELCVWPDDTPIGLNGCGLLVINPPWQFADQADVLLQWLFPHLKMAEQGGHAAVRWLVGE